MMVAVAGTYKSRRRRAGFTLVELVVALTVLGLLSAGLFSALRLSARTWDRGEARIAATGDAAAVRGFLRSRLEAAEPLLIPTGSESQAPSFVGTRKSLRFAAAMPPAVGIGGLYLFRLEQRSGGCGMLDWQLLGSDPLADVSDGRERPRPLFDGDVQLTLRYFGAAEPEARPQWYGRWEGERLPRLIEITFERANTAAGPTIPPLRVAPVASR